MRGFDKRMIYVYFTGKIEGFFYNLAIICGMEYLGSRLRFGYRCNTGVGGDGGEVLYQNRD